MSPTLEQLLELSHQLGREDRQLAILGEGNTSARFSAETFLVKASGSCLGTLTANDVVECRFDRLLPLLDQTGLTDDQIDAALFASRTDPNARKPSVEAVFHAYLLSLPDVQFVGHVHATAVNQVLCSPRARDFASHRMFPDEIVCCGPASVYIPYTDPGLPLSQEIRRQTRAFIDRYNRPPRVILMENHGIIATGKTPVAVLSALLMAEKAARIFVGAAQLGGPVFLSEAHVARIAGRPDERYRQRVLNL